MTLSIHGQYDITADREIGTRFILSIIALMVFMGLLALSCCFALYNMNKSWAADLRGIMTIEIPVNTPDGSLRPASDLRAIRSQIIESLSDLEAIKAIRPIPQEDIRQQLTPWLGDSVDLSTLPVPAMIHIELKDENKNDREDITKLVQSIQADIKANSHQQWLDDLARLSGSLALVSLCLMILIAVIVTLAVSGAVRARLASHAEEVDLLHLMGAQDHYIARQFQGHILALSIRGALTGLMGGILFILGFGLIASKLDLALAQLPPFDILQWLGLFLMPAIVITLSSFAAKRTVLSTLIKMP